MMRSVLALIIIIVIVVIVNFYLIRKEINS